MRKHLELRQAAPQEARQQHPQRVLHDQHGREAHLLLAGDGGLCLAQQVVGDAGLDAAAVGQRLLEHGVERAVQADDLHLAVAREELLRDRTAQRQARERGEFGGVLDGRRVLGHHVEDGAHVADRHFLVE